MIWKTWFFFFFKNLYQIYLHFVYWIYDCKTEIHALWIPLVYILINNYIVEMRLRQSPHKRIILSLWHIFSTFAKCLLASYVTSTHRPPHHILISLTDTGRFSASSKSILNRTHKGPTSNHESIHKRELIPLAIILYKLSSNQFPNFKPAHLFIAILSFHHTDTISFLPSLYHHPSP